MKIKTLTFRYLKTGCTIVYLLKFRDNLSNLHNQKINITFEVIS